MAALLFMILGPVPWLVVVPRAVGLFVGGFVGPRIARRMPEHVFRRAIGISRIVMASHFAVRTYSF